MTLTERYRQGRAGVKGESHSPFMPATELRVKCVGAGPQPSTAVDTKCLPTLNQESANYSPCLSLSFFIGTQHTLLCVVYDCFCATMADLSSHGRDHMGLQSLFTL